MKFYKPNGEEINKEQFIKLYSNAYFTGEVEGEKILGLNKNSKYIETIIENLLYDGFENEIDLVRIFAWKMGKIRLALSEKNKKFIYYKDWIIDEKNKSYSIKRYGNEFPIESTIKYILDNKDVLVTVNNPQTIINNLRNNSVKGVGTVYLITLLSFISKGEYPIYDKFAWLALQAIQEEQNPLLTRGIDYCSPPDIESKQFDEFISEKYCKEYIGLLHLFFDEDYKYRREIDQALWTYGHLFNKKTNKGC